MNMNTASAKSNILNLFEKTYPICFVGNEQDTAPTETALTKKQLFKLLTTHRSEDGKSTPAFIPGTFHDNSRNAEAIRKISLLVYDVDCKENYYSLRDLQSKLAGYTCCIHSTYNARYEHPRWRIILFIDTPIEPINFDATYRGIANKLDLEIDLNCTNINRLFYLPSTNALNDFRFAWHNEGVEISTTEYRTSSVDSKKDNQSRTKKRNSKKQLNTGYVSLSSIGKKISMVRGEGRDDTATINGFDVPPPLQAPFSQEEFDTLLTNPGSWLVAARYMGLDIDGISPDRAYSKSFSSVIPGVEDTNPSCSLGLLTNERTRLVYLAFNESHAPSSKSTGPVKIDLARIFAMTHCGRRIEHEAFPRATHKVWLTRLLIESGMIIPEPVHDLPDLPNEASNAKRLYAGFRALLMCKRSFLEYRNDPTTFTQTFACYWCGIGNRDTVKKYTQLLLDHNVFRFVDSMTVRGKKIPLMVPAGATAKVYSLKKRVKQRQIEQEIKINNGDVTAKINSDDLTEKSAELHKSAEIHTIPTKDPDVLHDKLAIPISYSEGNLGFTPNSMLNKLRNGKLCRWGND